MVDGLVFILKCNVVVNLRKLCAPLFSALVLFAPLIVLTVPGLAGAQAPTPEAATATASKPLWAELTPSQQQALSPLAKNWNAINEEQKRKWLEISKNYPALSEADRATLHSRMNEWVALSPQQRTTARINFAKTQELARELTADEKKAKWEQYQALSPEEKQKLAATANARPGGAAAAIKPVEAQKLAPVAPASRPPAQTAP